MGTVWILPQINGRGLLGSRHVPRVVMRFDESARSVPGKLTARRLLQVDPEPTRGHCGGRSPTQQERGLSGRWRAWKALSTRSERLSRDVATT